MVSGTSVRAHIEKGKAALAAGDLAAARTALDTAYWESDGTPLEVAQLTACLEIRVGNLEAAAYWVFEALRAAPEDDSVLVPVLRTARRIDPETAREWLARFPRARGEHPATHRLLRRYKRERKRIRHALAESKKLRRSGRFEEARQLVADARSTARDDARFVNELGQIAYAEGNFDRAREHYLEAHRLDPFDTYATNNLGKLASRRHQYRDAKRWFEQTLRQEPEDVFALAGLGQVALNRKQYSRARMWYELVLEQRPGDVVARQGITRAREGEAVQRAIQEAKAFRRQRDYVGAERVLLKAAAAYDNPVSILVELGLVAHGARRYDDARLLFVMAYQQEPQNLVVLNMLGALDVADRHPTPQQFDNAAEWFRRALRIDSNECRTLNNLAWLEMRRRRFDESLQLFDEVLRRDPDNAKALRGRGEVAMRRGEYEQAEQWWDKAWWEHGAEDPVLLTNLAKAAVAQGQFDTARSLLETARKRAPEDRYVLTSLAHVSLLEGHLAEAQSWLERAARQDPEDLRLLNLRGRLAQKRGERVQARRWYSETLQRDPLNTYALNGLGWTAYEEQHYDEAERWFAQVLELEADNAQALTGMGVTKSRRGEFQEAQECYRATLQKRFHPPALWHWFRVITQSGNTQQFSWFLDRAQEHTAERWVSAELSAWEERLRTLTSLVRDGEDPWPYVNRLSAELPRCYLTT